VSADGPRRPNAGSANRQRVLVLLAGMAVGAALLGMALGDAW